jgi:uncharacterized protein YbjT (DUF2867 family)
MTSLVLGPTGHVGPHVVSALRAHGEPVRALVRDPDHAASVLPADVELIGGDLRDHESVAVALRGAAAMFLLTPHGPSMAEDQHRLIALARQHDVRVVKLSGTSAGIRPDGPDACRQHWEVEQDLANGRTPHVILRPNAFMQGLVAGLAAGVVATGELVNPLGTAGLSVIDCADIGDAAAAVLTDPAHDGHTYTLTGPSAPTYREIAQQIGEVFGVEVTVVDSSPRQVGQAMRSRGATAWEADHLTEMLTMFSRGASAYLTDHVEVLTGHPPRSLTDYLRGHAQHFVTTRTN